MEIKDISVSVAQLDDVRGGLKVDMTNVGLQFGGNYAASSATSYGVGNQTLSSVEQVAPQYMSQDASVSAVEDHRRVLEISHSVIGGYLPRAF